jgi:glycosyltransferase involved in cell wall biosynthesis
MKAHVKNPADFKISACTIAKNEEKTIARSINSYKDYVDEIIVVDTGSADDTVKIAQSMGAKVLHFEWRDDFAAAKNTALDAAGGDWIVFLDADEYFADDTCKDLRTAIFDANLQNKNAIGCRKEDINSDDNDSIIAVEFNIRIFKAGTRYRYAIHEEPYNTEGVKILSVDKSFFYLKHTGYSKSVGTQKADRNLAILLKELKSEKNEIRVISYYLYISDAYFSKKKYKMSREYAEKFIKQSKKYNIQLIGCQTKPYANIINSLEIEKADTETIAAFVNEFEKDLPDSSDAAYAGGRNYMRSCRFNTALKKFDKAIKLSENHVGTYIDTVEPQKANVYDFCGRCEEGLLHNVNAIDWYFKAIMENDNYTVAIFNLFRIIRNMPQERIDSLVESLYIGKSQRRHISALSALMCNYMVPQLVKCYAAYKADKRENVLDADVAAFIMAGEGKYVTASNLFLLNHNSNGNKNTAMRCLLCAVLPGDKAATDKALEIASPAQAFALGLAGKPELAAVDLSDISDIYIECSRLGQIGFMKEKMDVLAPTLDDKQLLRFSTFLADGFAFDAALCAARHAGISSDSVFMQGYCLYRMRRLNEAAPLLLLARHMGCEKPALDEIYANIELIREKGGGGPAAEEKAESKKRIELKIEAGDFNGAKSGIEAYLSAAEADCGIFAAQAVLLYYYGEYKRAAIAAECGLLKDENNFDLLYNAGCIYEKLGDADKAKSMYLKALKNCGDSDMANQLRQTLGVRNQNYGI